MLLQPLLQPLLCCREAGPGCTPPNPWFSRRLWVCLQPRRDGWLLVLRLLLRLLRMLALLLGLPSLLGYRIWQECRQ